MNAAASTSGGATRQDVSLRYAFRILHRLSFADKHTLPSQLFTEDDGFKAPIAKFVRSRKDPKTGTLAPANLLLTARALELRDDIVCSFLFLEKTRRVNQTTSQRSADVLATPALSALTGHDYNVSNAGVP